MLRLCDQTENALRLRRMQSLRSYSRGSCQRCRICRNPAPAHRLIECSPDDGMGLSDRCRRERAAILAAFVAQLRIETVELISP